MAVTTRKKKSPISALNASTSQHAVQNQKSAKKSRTTKNDDDESIDKHDLNLDDDELSVGSNESNECRQLNNGDIDDDEEDMDEEMDGDDDDELFNSIMLKMNKRSTNSSFLQNKSQPLISMATANLHSMTVSAGLIRKKEKGKSSPFSSGSSSLKKSEEDDHDTHMARITQQMASRSVSSGSIIMNSLHELSAEDIKSSVTASPHDESTNLAVRCGFLAGTTTITTTLKKGNNVYCFTFTDGAYFQNCKQSITHAVNKGYINANEVDLSHVFPQDDVMRALQYGLLQKPDGTKFSLTAPETCKTLPGIWNLRTGNTYDSFHKCCNQEGIPIASITEPWFAARLERARQKGFSDGWGLTVLKCPSTQRGEGNYHIWSPTGTKYTSIIKARADDVNFGRLSTEEKMTKQTLRGDWKNMSCKDLRAEINRIHGHFKTEVKAIKPAGQSKQCLLNRLETWFVNYPRSFLSLPPRPESEE